MINIKRKGKKGSTSLNFPMNDYLEKLVESGSSLQVYKKGKLIFSSSKKGVRPHLDAIEKLGKDTLKESVMVDKIIGRAAALLILYVQASESYAIVISKGAKQLFEKSTIRHKYKIETDHIKTKNGVIYCPFEQMVQGIDEPEQAYKAILGKMAELNKE